MIRITQLRLPCGHSAESLENKVKKLLRLGNGKDKKIRCRIVRHGIDARKKPRIFDIYTVDVETGLSAREEQSLLHRLKNREITAAPEESYLFPASGTEKMEHRPVVIGAGPAGLFCALCLAKQGYRPILLERGARMEERTRAVDTFWKTGKLDPGTNVQFGEGGAGTFSDGKLNTQINDRTGRSTEVLRAFVEAGAPESILYEGKPHIGTDRLRTVIPNLRRRIETCGGEVHFGTRVTGFFFEGEGADRRIRGLSIHRPDSPEKEVCFLPADTVILAIGHSARDTVETLYREEIPMEQKQFAVGLRVAHPQSLIDESQYGTSDPGLLAEMRLGASPYKVTARASSGRGVYSFCMCPGGTIVNASSEAGHLCVNGMSNEKRDSGWANSAIVITVGEKEFGSSHVLAGMEFQRKLEKRAWELGQGQVPVQRYEDFRACFRGGKAFRPDPDQAESSRQTAEKPTGQTAESNELYFTGEAAGSFYDCFRGTCRPAPLHTLLPETLTGDLIEGMEQFGSRIRGFNGPSALLAGVESRTSSPVRIPRDAFLESIGAHGLYPCGEGAGYAGGIMSAAMDGIRVAEAVAAKYAPFLIEEGRPSMDAASASRFAPLLMEEAGQEDPR
ncbi:MAG: FAD-binding protein [Eubacteriales bacterium]|nr:FAD-binding protein [Eubacteriales bacterium]